MNWRYLMISEELNSDNLSDRIKKARKIAQKKTVKKGPALVAYIEKMKKTSVK